VGRRRQKHPPASRSVLSVGREVLVRFLEGDIDRLHRAHDRGGQGAIGTSSTQSTKAVPVDGNVVASVCLDASIEYTPYGAVIWYLRSESF